MKKHILLGLIAFACSLPMLAQESQETQESNDTLGIHPYKEITPYAEKRSHWSLYFPFGMTLADMDENGGAKLGSGLSDLTVNLGVGVEYSFTPMWGLAGEFNVSNYGKNSFYAKKNEDGSRGKDGNASFGNIYNMSLYATFDFADAFFPYRERALFSAYGMMGAGMGVYQFQAGDDVAYSSTRNKNGYNFDPFILFGLDLEFNATRTFSVGLRGTYNYYMSDNLDYSGKSGQAADNGRINSNNDGLFMVDAVLRWNINGDRYSHMRNTPNGKFAKDNVAKAVKDELGKAAAAAGDTTGAIAPFFGPIGKDTLVISHKDTLVSVSKSSVYLENSYYVYFDNDKSNLKDEALATIQQVAAILDNDTSLCAQITGYCDNTGNVAYNKRLSHDRASNVANEFFYEYSLDTARVYEVSRGIIKGKRGASSYGPNRRVEIRLVNREKFEQLKKGIDNRKLPETVEEEINGEKFTAPELVAPNYTGSNENKPAASNNTMSDIVDQASNYQLNTSAPVGQKENAKQPAQAGSRSRTYTVKSGDSLAKLSRRFYSNTHSWVYLYGANVSKLGGSTMLNEGMVLIIPELTDQQKTISREDAAKVYEAMK